MNLNQKINIDLPTIRKDIVLMSPGTWNGFEYSADDIKRAFELSDWKRASDLFLDHPENPNNAAGLWVGRIINQRYSDGQIIGDLQLWDENTIIKTELAKAPFGVSPRVIGEEDGNRFSNFTFDNWSIVSKQAIAPAYINLSKTPVKSQVLYKTDKVEVKELNEQVLSEEIKEFNRISEKIQKEEELTEHEYEYMKKKMKKKKEEHIPKEENIMKGGKNEMSETNQVDGSATQPEQKELSFDELSIEELSVILEKVQKILASKKPVVQEMAKKDLVDTELEELKNQVKELSAKLNKPAPKTVKSTGGDLRAQLTPNRHSEGVQELAQMLRTKYS